MKKIIAAIAIGVLLTFLFSVMPTSAEPMGPEERASAMIERAEIHMHALTNSLLFGLIPSDEPFEFTGEEKIVAEWHVEAEEHLSSAHMLFDANDFKKAKAEAELAKDIADEITGAYGFTIGYWAHQGAFDRANIRVLLIRDDNHGNEWETDTVYIKGILENLGYAVYFYEEVDLLAEYSNVDALAEFFETYDVVWLSNPGAPFNDETTVEALKFAMDRGVGIVLQGDDALLSVDEEGLATVMEISGLVLHSTDPNGSDWIDNNTLPVGQGYQVEVGLGHALQTGIANTTFDYGDDIDTCNSIGADTIASATPLPSDYPGQAKPVIAFFDDPSTGGRSVTVLLTIEQLEWRNPSLDPAFDDTLLDNIILVLAH